MAQMASKNPLEFFRQVRTEVAKVTWPTRKETTLTTTMVFVMVLLASIFFLAVDATLSTLITWILGFGG
ncbi:preprotein translocase subunit SecE [Dongia sp. agr-C8]